MGSPHRVAWAVALGASTAACALFVGDGDPFKLYPGPPDAARDSTPARRGDAGSDATPQAEASRGDGKADASCLSQVGLVAASSMNLYAAFRYGSGEWSTATTLTPWKVTGVPVLFPLPSGGYHAIVPTSGDSISSSLIDFILNPDATTTTPRLIPYGAVTNKPPAAFDVLSIASLAGEQYLLFNGSYAEFGYPVGYQGERFSPDAGDAGWTFLSQIRGRGPFPPSVAATSSYVVAAVSADAAIDGTGAPHAVEVLVSGVWQTPSAAGSSIASGPPRIVALGASTDDLLIVYPRSSDGLLESVARNAASGSWLPSVAVAGGVTTMDTPVVAAYGNGGAVLVTRDPTGHPFASVYSDSPSPTWSRRLPFGPATVNGPVTVGVGECNVPFAAYALPNDLVRVVSLEGTTWSEPEPVPGTLNATYLAIQPDQY